MLSYDHSAYHSAFTSIRFQPGVAVSDIAMKSRTTCRTALLALPIRVELRVVHVRTSARVNRVLEYFRPKMLSEQRPIPVFESLQDFYNHETEALPDRSFNDHPNEYRSPSHLRFMIDTNESLGAHYSGKPECHLFLKPYKLEVGIWRPWSVYRVICSLRSRLWSFISLLLRLRFCHSVW